MLPLVLQFLSISPPTPSPSPPTPSPSPPPTSPPPSPPPPSPPRITFYDYSSVDLKYEYVHSSNKTVKEINKKRLAQGRPADVMGVNDKLSIKCLDIQFAHRDASCCSSGLQSTNVSLVKAPAHWSVTCDDNKNRYWVKKDNEACCQDEPSEIANVFDREMREWDVFAHDPEILQSHMRNDEIWQFAEIVERKIRAAGLVPVFAFSPMKRISLIDCVVQGVLIGNPDPACPLDLSSNDPIAHTIRAAGTLIINIVPTCMKTKNCRFSKDNWFGKLDGTLSGLQAQINVETGLMSRGNVNREEHLKTDVQWKLDDPDYNKGLVVTELGNGRVAVNGPYTFGYGPYGLGLGSIYTNQFQEIAHLKTFIKHVESLGVQSVQASMERGNSFVAEVPGINNNFVFLDGPTDGTLAGKVYLFTVTYHPLAADGSILDQYDPRMIDEYLDWCKLEGSQPFSTLFSDFVGFGPLMDAIAGLMKADDLDNKPFPPFADFKDSFDQALIESEVPKIDWTDVAIVLGWFGKNRENPYIAAVTNSPTEESVRALYSEIKRGLLAWYEESKSLPHMWSLFEFKTFASGGFAGYGAHRQLAINEIKYGGWRNEFHTEDHVIGYWYAENGVNEETRDFPAEPRFEQFESMQKLYEAFACVDHPAPFTFSFGKSSGFTCPCSICSEDSCDDEICS